MNFFELLRYRKSTRMFTENQITREELQNIILAANSAPVGSNLYRDLHLTVVRDKNALRKLSEAAEKRSNDRADMEKITASVPGADPGRRVFDPFYGAPTVIFVSHRKQDIQPGIEYSNTACAAYSMHLAATGLGLGSVLMWFALESMRLLPELDNTDILNLPDGFEPLIGIAVGYPAKPVTARDLTPDKIMLNFL